MCFRTNRGPKQRKKRLGSKSEQKKELTNPGFGVYGVGGGYFYLDRRAPLVGTSSSGWLKSTGGIQFIPTTARGRAYRDGLRDAISGDAEQGRGGGTRWKNTHRMGGEQGPKTQNLTAASGGGSQGQAGEKRRQSENQARQACTLERKEPTKKGEPKSVGGTNRQGEGKEEAAQPQTIKKKEGERRGDRDRQTKRNLNKEKQKVPLNQGRDSGGVTPRGSEEPAEPTETKNQRSPNPLGARG